MKKELKAFNNNSRRLKGVKTKKFSEFANKRNHMELFCKMHMRDRLLMFCHQDCLIDVVMNGSESIQFRTYCGLKAICKCCDLDAKFRIDRVD